MASTIKLKNGSGAPLAGDLVQGEPALDLTNKRLYTENASGTVIEVGTNPTSITTGTITASGEITANGGIALGDNDKATFGASDDLQIYHDGTHSYVEDAGAGNLILKGGADVIIRSASNDADMIRANIEDSVQLYFNGLQKLATTSTGIDVTGTVTADGLTVDGDIEISDATEAKLTMVRSGVRRYDVTVDGSANFTIADNALGDRFKIASNGDISFYEDTGTTAKFFWDASAESLGIGTSSPSAKLAVVGTTKVGEGVASNTSKLMVNTASGTAAGIQLFQDGVESWIIQNPASTTALTFANSGSERMRIDSSGNVGIGTSSPSAKTHIHVTETSPSSVGAGVRIQGNTNDYGLNIGADTSYAYIQGVRGDTTTTGYGDLILQPNSGSLLVGTTTNNYAGTKLNVGDNTDSQNGLSIQTSSTGYGYVLFSDGSTGTQGYTGQILYNHASNYMSFGVNGGAERMRIDSSGNLLVGTTTTNVYNGTTTGVAFTPSGYIFAGKSSDAPLYLNRTTNDGAIAKFQRDGTTVGSISVTSSTTTYNITSDQRLKDNIVDAPAGNVDDIKVRSFDWKADGSHQDYGMVAQELEAVAPYAVTKGETEDDMWSVDYSKLVPMLVKEIQSLRARVAQLETN